MVFRSQTVQNTVVFGYWEITRVRTFMTTCDIVSLGLTYLTGNNLYDNHHQAV